MDDCQCCGGKVDPDLFGTLQRQHTHIYVEWVLCNRCTCDLIKEMHRLQRRHGRA